MIVYAGHLVPVAMVDDPRHARAQEQEIEATVGPLPSGAHWELRIIEGFRHRHDRQPQLVLWIDPCCVTHRAYAVLAVITAIQPSFIAGADLAIWRTLAARRA